MTKRQRIIECPRCGKQICITLETLDDLTFVDVEKEESEKETPEDEKLVRTLNIDWELVIAVLGLVALLLLVLFGVV